jgi:hypothetical protein
MSYTDLTDVKAELGIPVNVTTEDTIILAKIAEAQAEIDRLSGRRFEAITTTRTYNAFYDGFSLIDTAMLLLDDDLLTVTSLTNGDGTTIPVNGSAYWLEPQNMPPYKVIRLKSAYAWNFDTDGQVSVTGTWGKTATAPADIVGICKELAIALYRLKDTPTMSTTTAGAAGATPFPIALPKHAESVINNYRSLV